MKKVLIDSLSRRMGDTCLGLPLTSMVRQFFYGEKVHVTFACGPHDFEFFKNISTIDDVCLQTIFNPVARAYDISFDEIIRGSFDADVKYANGPLWDKLDNKEGWDLCRKNFPIKLNYKSDFINSKISGGIDHGKPRVAIFINFPRQDSSMPKEMSYYPLEKWQEVINLLKEFDVYVFTSKMEQDFHLDNCIMIGKLNACEEILVMSRVHVVIGVTSGLMGMMSCFSGASTVTLQSCEDDGTPVWSGIPDKCNQPQNRYNYLIMDNEDNRSFIKPPKGSRIVQWNFSNFFKEKTYLRNMRTIEDIEPQEIANEVCRLLKTGRGKEWFINGSLCENCQIKKELGKCAYNYTPQIKRGGYMEGNYADVG